MTGNLLITAKAKQNSSFTNLVPTAVSKDGTDFNVDGDGYVNNTYINSSGEEGTRKNGSSTGFIPVTAGAKTIRIAGEGISIDPTYTRIAGYDAEFNLLICLAYNNMGIQHSDGIFYQGELIRETDTLLTLVLGSMATLSSAVYLRICVDGDGSDLIVTVNEEVSHDA